MFENKQQRERRLKYEDWRMRRIIKEGIGSCAQVSLGRTAKSVMQKIGNYKKNLWLRFQKNRALLGGEFNIEHWRGDSLLRQCQFHNDITDEGLTGLLNIQFHASTQITTWYIGLISDTGYTALADDDAYVDINGAGNGWDEFTDYTDANNGDSTTTRPVWPEDAASGNSITNATTKAIYDIVTTSEKVKGIFVCGGGTQPEDKDDATTGSTLWSTALFSGGDVTVTNGDQLKITYTVNATRST
jgi:hypothetical protein